MTVDPAKTYVISVGISRYAINDTWDLSLAGDYAMRFVEWARSYHVPPGNIFLFLADMDHKRLAGQARQAGVAIRSATSDEVNGFLKSSTFYDLSGDLLYTYWFGHGSVTNNGTRHLFFSDMRPDLAPTLDFNHYLLRLRSKGLSNFRLQNAFIDACASRYGDIRELEVEPASLNPPAKGDADYVDQRCIFSAKAGVDAVAGCFSEYILDELRRRSAKQWPPDSDSIARAASRNPKLKGQHPQQFYIKTASEEYSVGELPASVSINRAADQAHCGVSWFRSFAEVAAGLPTLSTSNSARRRLYCAAVNRTDDNRTNRLTPYDDLLESVAFAYATNHVPQLQAAYKALEERSFELDQIISRINLLRDANIALSHCGFAPDTLISAFAASIRTLPHDPIREGMPLQSMLYELAQAESGGEMYKARPLYEFVLRLAADPRITPAASAKLHAFVTSHCPVAMKASIESELRAKLRFILSVSIDQEEQNGPLGVVAHLMSEDEILRQFTVRKYYGRTVCDTDDAVAARVSDIVKDVRTFLKAPEHDEVDVEFLLPLELFGALAPEEFRIQLQPETSLAKLYPVVVRWRERYEFPEYCSKILTWRELAEEINRQKPAKLKWLNKKHFANGKEPAVFPAVMGLSFLAERELFDLVQHGAPFIVWPRREPRDGFPRLRSRIDAWAQAHETTVQLRRRLIVLRKSHLDAHNGVAVFWDEPTRRYPFKYEDVQFAQEDTLA